MRIYTPAGDLAFSTFNFPDGQPHFRLETYEREFSSATIEASIESPLDLFQIGLANDVLRNNGYSEVNLDIRYLLGARMDRAIDVLQPFTLQSVARIINSWGLSKIRILDVHSEVATKLIRNSVNVRPYAAFEQVVATVGPDVSFVSPDKGAENRTSCFANTRSFIRCEKDRDPTTGKISGFRVWDYNPNPNAQGKNLLIIDDICDGGATFTGLAEALRKRGAEKIYLWVTHGIFSRGVPLKGIDHIYTTDSYRSRVNPGLYQTDYVTVIPVSMKEMK